MALKTGQEYLESARSLSPRVYIGGKRVANLFDHPTTLSVVKATAVIYDLAHQPEYQKIMTATSHLSGEVINRNLHVAQNTEDLSLRADMALLTSQKLGTCNYRCVGADAINALASVTWEIDKNEGTEYHQRFINYLKYLQDNDLACSGGVTDAKGDRSKRPSQQDDLDMNVRIVEKRSDGIVVSGAKVSQSGAIACHETIVIPGGTLRPGEGDFAVAFAFPNGAPGVTYICQYTPFTAERELMPDIDLLGNPDYGVRETSMIIFDNVFIPWERVFLCGETKYTGRLISRFAKTHRMNCGGACKVGYADLIIGATQLIAEYTGVARAPHVVDKITEMVRLSETSHACAIAAAVKGREEPEGSGVYLPDDLFGNVAKLNIAHGFWEIMKLAGDIAGGMVVTAPSELDLCNEETRAYIEKYLKSIAPADKRLRILKFLQNWTAGLHGPGTWHGAGSPQAQRMSLYALTNFEEKKALAKALAKIKD